MRVGAGLGSRGWRPWLHAAAPAGLKNKRLCSCPSYKNPWRLRLLHLLRRHRVPLRIQIPPLPQIHQTPVPSPPLGLVERLVREEDELGSGLDVEVGEAGDSGAQGQGDLLALVFEVELFDGAAEALGDREGVVSSGLLQEEEELFAPVAAAEVRAAAHAFEDS